MPQRLIWLCVSLWLGFSSGCSSQVQVRGHVTANGTAVADGFVNFQSADGLNSNFGAPIKDGKFLATLKPGHYVVLVTGGKAPAYPKSQEDLKKMSAQELRIADEIPADAKGNQAPIEITSSSQPLNLALEYAPRK